jgi:DNA-binding response OmpR family regulator
MKKILIIDDDKTFHETMLGKLIAQDFTVLSAFDGEQGLIMVQSEKPDIILLDIKMPKKDGMDFLHDLRKIKDMPIIPILITSNLSTTEQIADGISLGVAGYIVKSNETTDTIISEIKSILAPI